MSCCKTETKPEIIEFFKECGIHSKEQIIEAIKYQDDELSDKNFVERFNDQVDKYLDPIEEENLHGYCSSCSSLIDRMNKEEYKIVKDFILGFIIIRRGVCESNDRNAKNMSDIQASKSVLVNDFNLYLPIYFIFSNKLDRVCKSVFDEHDNDDINNIKLEIYRLKK